MSTNRSPGSARGGHTRIKWYRRLSVKLALGLGFAMFAIQVLTTQLLVQTYQSSLEDFDTPTRNASKPFAAYLSNHLERDEQRHWVPTEDAIQVVENFLDLGETYLWLDRNNRVLRAGRRALELTSLGDEWPLCDSPEYCEILLDDGERLAGSSWSQLAIGKQPIGAFVHIWFEAMQDASAFSKYFGQIDVFTQLVASGLVATLTSVLLVSLVTHRLSKLASEASAPLDETVENVDLPGPFEATGDDEIARLARTLNIMRSRIVDLVASLEERDRQRREWIAQVSHDLRTPLTALSACLDRARERLELNEDPCAQSGVMDAIVVARQDGHRLQTLVDDLFELARLDAQEELILEPVPPGELVRQTVRGLRPMAQAHGIELVAVIAPALPTIRADGRRLMRALENMVRNAVQFGHSSVQLLAECEHDHLRFEVRDDGPGLPIENGHIVLAHVGDRSRPDAAGLGLVVTRRVAAAHGGDLGAANRPEGGARVWIRIPIVIAHDSDDD